MSSIPSSRKLARVNQPYFGIGKILIKGPCFMHIDHNNDINNNIKLFTV
jgi:hypothetical protein